MFIDARSKAAPANFGGGFINCTPRGAGRVIPNGGIDALSRWDSPQPTLTETIVDWDVADKDDALAVAMHALPSAAPILVFHYRVRGGSIQNFGDEAVNRGRCGSVITTVHSGVLVSQQYGPIGMILARLRPEAVSRLVGDQAGVLDNGKIDLDAIFGHVNIHRVEQRLSEAATSNERIRLVSDFLEAHANPRPNDPRLVYAVQALRRNPALRIRSLADHLDISERQLSRWFQLWVGMSPKHFARLARCNKAITARSTGLAWAQVSYACGFVDQAHMIHDMAAILGGPPAKALSAFTAKSDVVGTISQPKTLVMW